jgi:hypothetical protein
MFHQIAHDFLLILDSAFEMKIFTAETQRSRRIAKLGLIQEEWMPKSQKGSFHPMGERINAAKFLILSEFFLIS